MTNEILIDAAHQEEVRVAVLKNNRLEEYDFEFDSRRPIRGNIYLAKVTRVEPSLQAAFVDYVGNRNGFTPARTVFQSRANGLMPGMNGFLSRTNLPLF